MSESVNGSAAPNLAAAEPRAKVLTVESRELPDDTVLAASKRLRWALKGIGPEPGAPMVVPVVTSNGLTTVEKSVEEPYEILCASVRGRVERLRQHVAKETWAIATELLAAKRDYEGETGTGHGKRNPQRAVPFKKVAEPLVGKSARWVEDHVRLALRLEHDTEAVAQLVEMADISCRLMLAFADEKTAVRRLLALEAHRTSGAEGMRKALEGHPLARCAGLFLDPKSSPYAQPASLQLVLPDLLVKQFPELAPYAGRRIGDVVAALKSNPPQRAAGHRPPPPITGTTDEAPSALRRICLPRDGTVVDGLRVISVTEQEVMLEVGTDVREGPSPANAPTKPTPTPPSRTPRRGPAKAAARPQAYASAAPPVLEAPPDGARDVVQFSVDQAALTNALRIAELVKPLGVTEHGAAGYLFDVGGGVCRVRGRTGDTAVSAAVPARGVEGEGQFAFPVNHVESLKLRPGQAAGVISFQAYAVDDTRYVRYATSGGISAQRSTFDPALLTPMGKPLAESTNPRRYKSAILSQALTMAQPFMVGATTPKDDHEKRENRNAPPAHKVANIHEARWDGTLFATNGHERFAFYCDDFTGKVAQFPADRFRLLLSFLRWCGPEVELRDGKEMNFAVSGDGQRAVGWTRRSSPILECKLLPSSWYRVVLRVPREAALEQLKQLRAEIEKQSQRKGWDKTRIRYASATRRLHLEVVDGGTATSAPIPVELAEGSEDFDYEYNISATYLMDLLDRLHTVHAELGMLPMAEHGVPQGGAVFRTVDEFLLDRNGKVVGGRGAAPDPAIGVFQCKVLRLAPASPP